MTTQSQTLASQATAELPKLPEPAKEGYVPLHELYQRLAADQVQAYGLACYEAGRASRAQSEWISVETRRPEANAIVLVSSTGWDKPKVLKFEARQLTLDGERVLHERFIDNDTGRWYWYPERMSWHELPATLGETK